MKTGMMVVPSFGLDQLPYHDSLPGYVAIFNQDSRRAYEMAVLLLSGGRR